MKLIASLIVGLLNISLILGDCIVHEKGLLDDTWRQAILDKHNELRNKVAGGNEAGQPGSSNMNKFSWDMELEVRSQDLAEKCEFKHSSNDSRPNAGENIARWGKQTLKLEDLTTLSWYWYNEVTAFDDLSNIDNWNPKNFFSVGHYTQVAWAATSKVGCGAAIYSTEEGGAKNLLFFCQYWTAGNWYGAQMYAKGAQCTECAEGDSCDTDYPALCANPSTDYKVDTSEYFGKNNSQANVLQITLFLVMVAFTVLI